MTVSTQVKYLLDISSFTNCALSQQPFPQKTTDFTVPVPRLQEALQMLDVTLGQDSTLCLWEHDSEAPRGTPCAPGCQAPPHRAQGAVSRGAAPRGEEGCPQPRGGAGGKPHSGLTAMCGPLSYRHGSSLVQKGQRVSSWGQQNTTGPTVATSPGHTIRSWETSCYCRELNEQNVLLVVP